MVDVNVGNLVGVIVSPGLVGDSVVGLDVGSAVVGALLDGLDEGDAMGVLVAGIEEGAEVGILDWLGEYVVGWAVALAEGITVSPGLLGLRVEGSAVGGLTLGLLEGSKDGLMVGLFEIGVTVGSAVHSSMMPYDDITTLDLKHIGAHPSRDSQPWDEIPSLEHKCRVDNLDKEQNVDGRLPENWLDDRSSVFNADNWDNVSGMAPTSWLPLSFNEVKETRYCIDGLRDPIRL
jgi:hypothetical protein